MAGRWVEYDYAEGFRLIDAGLPGVGGCLGCFRCRVGDHGSCHGCSCACGWTWQADLYDADFTSPCPDKCRCRGHCPDDGTHRLGCRVTVGDSSADLPAKGNLRPDGSITS